MSQRAEALAQRFEDANNALIEIAQSCTPEQWTAHSRPENCSVAALTYHVALAHPFLLNVAQSLANDQPARLLDRETLDKVNAENARTNAQGELQGAVDLLRRNGAEAAAAVRALSDEQLDRSQAFAAMGGAVLTTEAFIQNVLIGHPQQHGQSIRETLNAAN
jgi:hypothetical protein